MVFTVLEAMACGIPAIATSVGGVHEVSENSKYGILIVSEDEWHLTRALKELIQNHEKRHTIGIEGRKRILSPFSLKKMGAEYQVLNEALLQKGGL